MFRLAYLFVLLLSLGFSACKEGTSDLTIDQSIDLGVGFIDYKVQSTTTDQSTDQSDSTISEVAGAETAGDMVAGAETAGDMVAGAETAGDIVAGAETAGDMVAGAETAGDMVAGAETAGGATPVCVPTEEHCDGIDNDCDSLVDEGLTMTCSALERGGMLGLCGEAKVSCVNGEWESCDFDVLAARQTELGNLINSEEQCDCYDNNCNGIVDEPNILTTNNEIDWRSNTCTPNLDQFTAPQRFSPQCHFYPMYEEDSNTQRPHYLDLSDEYFVDSFVVHSGARVHVSRPEGARGPGYSQTIPSLCIENRWITVGGDLELNAHYIQIEQGAALIADSVSTTCRSTLVTSTFESITGASGGNLHLYANLITIEGILSVSGASPTNIEPTFGNYDSYAGGAAGSIYLVAPTVNLSGAMINARGGRGACPAINVFNREFAALCDDSLHAGEGPGQAGGRPVEGRRIGGAGSGGPGYEQNDPDRGIKILGHLLLNADTTLKVHDGTGSRNGVGRCSGQLLLSGGSRQLWSQVDCTAPYPDSFQEDLITVMLLDDDGNLHRNDSLVLKIFSFLPNVPLFQSNFAHGALTIPRSTASIQSGSRYTIELSPQMKSDDDSKSDEDNTSDESPLEIDLDDYELLILIEYDESAVYQEVLRLDDNGQTMFQTP